MKQTKWIVTLSKDGDPFDTASFRSLTEATRWAEQLRMVDNYLVTIQQYPDGGHPIMYIYSREDTYMEYTQSLFSRFR